MPPSQNIESLLDVWESRLADDPQANLYEFLQSETRDLAADDREEFIRRAKHLAEMDGILNALNETGHKQNTTKQPSSISQKGRIQLASGKKPIPGYTLVELLGRGGFGEVWKAKGPGGFLVALKFVNSDEKSSQVELRSLKVMRNVRHAHLLSLFGAWRKDGVLIIASELADCSLLDRFQQAVEHGKQGIPTQELLEYMQEAAKGIDFLNQPDGKERPKIQHRDIKPQNLLISGGSVKVGDFGLVRAFSAESTDHTGSLTLLYAAPEFFSGKTSSRSDQYSLAITYCYLKSGQVPFRGSHAEVVHGHCHQPPDLSMLTDSERPVVERALSKLPENRWKSCREFVQKLCEAVRNPQNEIPKQNQIGHTYRSRIGLISVSLITAIVLLAIWDVVNRDVPIKETVVGTDERQAYSNRPQARITNSVSNDSPSGRGNISDLANSTNVPHSKMAEVNSGGSLTDDDRISSRANATYGTHFQDCPSSDRVLIGLEVTTGQYGSSFRLQAVGSVRPIYRGSNGQILSGKVYGYQGSNAKRLVARDGFAVSVVKLFYSLDRIVGIQVQFMRVGKQHFATDSAYPYWSNHYLRKTVSAPKLIDGQGALIRGISGRFAKQELRDLSLLSEPGDCRRD